MQKISTQTSFVKPHYNEEAGFEGLWDHEIAKSLSVSVEKVREKLRRNKKILSKHNFHVFTSVTKKIGLGRRPLEYFLEVDVAKYFVCTWKSNKGVGYFRFLIDCERVATELTPKLFARIEELETENKKLNASQPVPQLRKPKQAIVPIWGSNLWDEPAIIGWRRIDAREASPVDVARGKLHHNRKIADGLARSNEQCQSILDKSLHPGAQNAETEARDNILYLQSGQNVEQTSFSRSY